MSRHHVEWKPGMAPLGRCVVAIGVFDGVHLGHRSLLEDTVAEARFSDARSVAVTFDRDPDQVVTPETAAPQLLTLDDKARFIAECGVNVVLVVPFTSETANLAPERFLDEVLGSVAEVVAIHVGEDFRFGARAAGDIETLRAWAASHEAQVRGHDLVEHEGSPVTSTRIRKLVGDGDVEAAAELLGRPTRVSGTVHRGRMQGRLLGFPTANVVPVPFAALPADGVYAGYAELDSGMSYRAAISVGTPPSFPEARDYLEAHVIGFEGDLYDQRITLSFAFRLRDQRSFESMDELTDAIGADVMSVTERLADPAGFTAASYGPQGESDYLEDGSPVVDDPIELAAAEAAAAKMARTMWERDETWVPVTGARHVSGMFSVAGVTASLVTSPLEAAGIPYAWDPYEPRDMPSFRIGYGAIDRRFTLYVPEEHLAEARRLLGVRDTEPGVQTADSDEPWTLGRIAGFIVAAAIVYLLTQFFALQP